MYAPCPHHDCNGHSWLIYSTTLSRHAQDLCLYQRTHALSLCSWMLIHWEFWTHPPLLLLLMACHMPATSPYCHRMQQQPSSPLGYCHSSWLVGGYVHRCFHCVEEEDRYKHPLLIPYLPQRASMSQSLPLSQEALVP